MGQPKPKDDQNAKPSKENVSGWIMTDGPEAEEELEKLAAMGERLFPAFEAILDDPEYARSGAWRVFVVLRMMKCDRSRFLDRAVARLGDDSKESWVRDRAIEFLGSAGGEAEAAPLALMLLSKGERYSAAEALAAIGGKGQVAVFDLIIKNATRYEEDGKLILNNFDIEHFEKCRDQLKARLAKQEKEKAEKKPAEKK